MKRTLYRYKFQFTIKNIKYTGICRDLHCLQKTIKYPDDNVEKLCEVSQVFGRKGVNIFHYKSPLEMCFRSCLFLILFYVKQMKCQLINLNFFPFIDLNCTFLTCMYFLIKIGQKVTKTVSWDRLQYVTRIIFIFCQILKCIFMQCVANCIYCVVIYSECGIAGLTKT